MSRLEVRSFSLSLDGYVHDAQGSVEGAFDVRPRWGLQEIG